MGGDEFTVILRSITKREGIKKVVRNILQALHQPFYLDEHKCLVGASIGISLFPEHGKDAEILLDRADQAMYKIKHKSKGSFSFYRDQAGLESESGEKSGAKLRPKTKLKPTLKRKLKSRSD